MGDTATTAVETETATPVEPTSEETILTSSEGDAAASTEEGTTDPGEASDGGDAGAEGSGTLPDTYADFDMPEGVTLNEAVLSEATPLFKEAGLSQEQAQKLIDLYAGQIQAGSKQQTDDFNQLMSDWRDQSKNDPEFGGDNFEANVKIARKSIDVYGTPELKQLLEEHGVGNHPALVRYMVAVGKTLPEDVPGSPGSASSTAQDRVSILYPDSEKT